MSYNYERGKQYREKMKREQRCFLCGAQDERTLIGLTRCGICTEKDKQRFVKWGETHPEEYAKRLADQKEWRKQLKEHHLCVDCRKQDAFTLGGRPKCAECAAKDSARVLKKRRLDPKPNRDSAKARRQLWRDEHKCSRCGHPLPNDYSYRTCWLCREKCRIAREARRWRQNPDRNKRGMPGVCWQCVKRPVMEGKKLCEECYNAKLPLILKAAEIAHANNRSHIWRRQQT